MIFFIAPPLFSFHFLLIADICSIFIFAYSVIHFMLFCKNNKQTALRLRLNIYGFYGFFELMIKN